MINRVTFDPHSRPGSVHDDLEALRHAAEQRNWRDFVRDVPAMLTGVGRVTETVESSWSALSDEDQDSVLFLKDTLQEAVESSPQPNIAERVMSHLSRTNDEEKRQIRRLMAAFGGFLAVVNHQLREEERIRALLDKAMTADADIVAEVERGVAEEKAGLGNTYTLAEFRARFG